MGKKVSKKEPEKRAFSKQILAFAVVAGAVTGYLLFRAASEPPSQAPSGPPPATHPSHPSPLAEGSALPVVPLISLSGEQLELRAPGGSRPIILFIFSPTCSICHETLPTWKEIYQEAKSRAIEVVGLSVLDPSRTAQYVQSNEVPWNVYCLAGKSAADILHIERVPVTLLLDGSGEISIVMGGRISAEQQETISKVLQESSPS
jgi:peroxiredoxin